MSDGRPTRQSIAVAGRSNPGKVTGKLKVAIDAMIWQGIDRATAALAAGLADHSLREALKKPHVRNYFRDELTNLRTSAKAKAVHRMVELSQQDDNRNAAVAATKALLVDDDEDFRRVSAPAPGLTIIFHPPDAPVETFPPPMIDVTPPADAGDT